MFNTLASTLLSWVSKGLDAVLDWLLKLMGFNLSFFSENFPVVNTMYSILQGVGVALLIAVAVFQLIKFFTGPLSEQSAISSPLEIIVRMILSIFLIFIGNYFLEMIVNLFSYPYNALMNIDPDASISVMDGAAAALTTIATGGAGLLIALIMIVAIGWNTIKLVIEVVERYLMVGVLTYTSPLAWATISSRATHTIFSKWFSMFLGQCLLMLLNVWSVNMLISIMSNTNADVFFRFIIALAFCKIAQRFDTYLQALGVNAAHTGGSMADDLMAIGATIGKTVKGITGSASFAAGNKPLGDSILKGGIPGVIGYGIGSRLKNSNSAPDSSRNAGGGASTRGNNPASVASSVNPFENNNSPASKNNTPQTGPNMGSATVSTSGQNTKNSNPLSASKNNSGVNDVNISRSPQMPANTADEATMHPNTNEVNTKQGNTGEETQSGKFDTDTITKIGGSGNKTADPADANAVVGDGREMKPDTTEAGKTDASDVKSPENASAEKKDISDLHGHSDDNYDDFGEEAAMKPDTEADAREEAEQVEAEMINAENEDISELKKQQENARKLDDEFGSNIDVADNKVIHSDNMDASDNNVVHNGNTGEGASQAIGGNGENVIGRSSEPIPASSIKAMSMAKKSADSAYTLMNTNIDGGIKDEQVISASYNKMFGDSTSQPENGIETVLPGLTQQVENISSDTGLSGDTSAIGLNMNDGEIRGTYTPSTANEANGEIPTQQDFSIRTEDAYNRLNAEEQSGYTEFSGADGRKYYAKTTSAQVVSMDMSQPEHITSSSATVSRTESTISSSSNVKLEPIAQEINNRTTRKHKKNKRK